MDSAFSLEERRDIIICRGVERQNDYYLYFFTNFDLVFIMIFSNIIRTILNLFELAGPD